MIQKLKVTQMGHLHPAPAEGEVLDSVATEEIRHLLQHRWLVQVELVRASGTPTNHAEEESAHTHARTEVVHNILWNRKESKRREPNCWRDEIDGSLTWRRSALRGVVASGDDEAAIVTAEAVTREGGRQAWPGHA